MIDWLLELDKDVFLYLNGLHTPWLDPVMLFITNTWASLPLYLILIVLIFKVHGKQCWIVLIGIALTIIMADQITSGLMKPYFLRLRPSHEPSLQGLVHIVNNYAGGKYGFASSHAANTFGTAAFLYLLFRQILPAVKWLFLWAFIIAYSRIYLGVHYPGDVLVGGIVGILAGWVAFMIVAWAMERMKKKENTEII